MPRTKVRQAFTQLILEVFRLNGRLLSAGDALTRPVGQTSARWLVLGALEEEGRTVADIGRWMGLTRQSVQRTADLLEADGLVSYADNPAHQRAKLATLTSRGRATLDTITSSQIAWANRIANGLSEGDVQHAIRALRQVRQAMEASSDRTMKPVRARKTAPGKPGSTKRRSA